VGLLSDLPVQTDGEGEASPASDLGPPDPGSADLPLPFLPPQLSVATRYAAGAAGRDITPVDQGAHMGGFGFCLGKPEACRYSQGTHDPLHLAAAAMADPETGEVVIFVGLDSVGLIKADIVAIQEAAPEAFANAFGIQLAGERVVVGASHTHSASDTVGLWGPMLGDEREEEPYIAQVKDAALEAALEAFGNLGDATLTWGTGSAPNHGSDLAAEDEVVFSLRAARPNGDTVFTLTRWPSHPTVYGSGSNALSADWVGTFRRRMEDQTGGVAVFLNGPIGSVYPDHIDGCLAEDPFVEGWLDPDLSPAAFAQAACIGYNVADEALAALAEGTPVGDEGIRFRHAQFEFHPTNFALAALLSISAIPWDPVDPSDPESTFSSRFSWISIGHLDLLTNPGESFPSFAAHGMAVLAQAGHPNTFVLGLTQDWMGYLLAEEQWEQEDLAYHRGISPGPEVEAAFLARLQELVDEDYLR